MLTVGLVFTQLIADISKKLNECKNTGNKDRERHGYFLLGKVYYSLGDMKQAIQHYERFLRFEMEIKNKAKEAQVYTSLGIAHHTLGDFKRAIIYHQRHLDIAKELQDKAEEGRACGNLGNAHNNLGDFKQALKYHNQDLAIAKELKDSAAEGQAYCNIGNAYRRLGDFREAMENYKQHLRIAQELKDRARVGRAWCNLGNVSLSLGDWKQAIKYQEQALVIAQDMGDKSQEGRVYCSLGGAHRQLGDFKTAIEYHKQHLAIAESVSDKAAEASAHGNLGNAYHGLGDFDQAVECHQKQLHIARARGYRHVEGLANCNLSSAYQHLGDYRKSLNHGEQFLQIAREVEDKAGTGRAYGLLASAQNRLGNFEKAIEYDKLNLQVSIDLRDPAAEGLAYGSLGSVYQHSGDFKQAIEYYQQALGVFSKLQNSVAEAKSNFNLGVVYEALSSRSESLRHYKDSVKQWDIIRTQLQSQDDWKISLRNRYQIAYGALWSALLEQSRYNEALCVAEQGRAQALLDLMIAQYGFDASPSDVAKPTNCNEISEISPFTILFLAVRKNKINMWVLRKEKGVIFRRTETDRDAASCIESALKTIRQNLVAKRPSRCEDRSLDGLEGADAVDKEEEEKLEEVSEATMQHVTSDGESSSSPDLSSDGPLSNLYDLVIAPVADLLDGEELIVVPDGPLFLTPFAAFQTSSRYLCESFRIRVLPSLTSLKLIANSAPDYHKRNGALIVGDPFVQEIVQKKGRSYKKLLGQLPGARSEAEMIGGVLNVLPLIGEKATKAEVLERLNSVALIHIAAHGKMETGEIALAPNPKRVSKIPVAADYLLTMADVLSVRVRAKLVVLSCCHSGRGQVKAEGVVGIARAFLGAGARCVLVSLWAIEDDASMEFMRSFYQQLVDGKSASESLNQSMKRLRESQTFNRIKCWAPFVLIGDDVTLESADSSGM